MKKVQSQSTSNPAAVSQAAAQEALDGDQSCIQPMLTAFKERHDYVVQALNRMPGVRCTESDGTFYCFPDFSAAIASLQDVNDDVELADFFLQKAGVALVPGSAFGAPGYLRLSFAASMDVLETALGRLKRALSS
jgi:aspartate aminotransferase